MNTSSACALTVDGWGMQHVIAGTAVDTAPDPVPTVDEWHHRPTFILTHTIGLTCDDAPRPQFPQHLLLRRIQTFSSHISVQPGDEQARGRP